jgi:pyruvate/2-oxoglutarate dehydrogenase complex dihydrolipoamide acyltransferase (E2) component
VIAVELPPLDGSGEWSGGAATEAEVARWLVDDGARVALGAPLVEVALDKVSVTVDAPAAGVLRREAAEGDLLVPGDLLATIDED